MIKLGVNTVLFKAFSFREAAKAIALAGYDGLEISAIAGMCEHLAPMRYREQIDEIRDALAETGLTILSMEAASHDPERMEKAFEAAAKLGIPIVNVGPGGKTGDEESFRESIKSLKYLAERARAHGVTLCCKAHVGAAIRYAHDAAGDGRDIRSGFRRRHGPATYIGQAKIRGKALPAVLPHPPHTHTRLQGPPPPGDPLMQTCGRGDIDLWIL